MPRGRKKESENTETVFIDSGKNRVAVVSKMDSLSDTISDLVSKDLFKEEIDKIKLSNRF